MLPRVLQDNGLRTVRAHAASVLTPLAAEAGRRRRASRAGPAPTPEQVVHQHVNGLFATFQRELGLLSRNTMETAVRTLRPFAEKLGLPAPPDSYHHARAHPQLQDLDARRAPLIEKTRRAALEAAEAARAALPAKATREEIAKAMTEAVQAQMYRMNRIIDTEGSYAFNAARRTAITEMHRKDRRILMRWTEHVDDLTGQPLDKKVGMDSMAMHGQVAAPGESFYMPANSPGVSFPAGASWSGPPNRPNDRAVLLPWVPGSDVPAWSYQNSMRVQLAADATPPRMFNAQEVVDELAARSIALDERLGVSVRERLTEMFPDGVTAEQLDRMMRAPEGLEAFDRKFVPRGENGLRMTARYRIPGGEEVTKLPHERTLVRGSSGRLTADHDYMVFIESAQGSGYGTALLRQQLQTYEELGVQHIHVGAAWEGRYVWPKLGFDFEDGIAGREAKETLDRFQRFLVRQGVDAVEAIDIRNGIREARDIAGFQVQQAGYVPPVRRKGPDGRWLEASHPGSPGVRPLGYEFLISSSAESSIAFGLDLTDATQRERYRQAIAPRTRR